MEPFRDFVEYFEIEEENKLILEFSNIGPKTHKFGIELTMHIMQPDINMKLKHGPRAKFFKRGSNDEFCITINNNPKVVGKWDKLVSQHECNVLLSNIKKFKVPLLNFWYDPKMNTDELEEQLIKIRKGGEVAATYKERNK